MKPSDIKVGKKYQRNEQPNYQAECRVMAIVEGWVMARFKGATPFLLREAEFCKDFTPIDPALKG